MGGGNLSNKEMIDYLKQKYGFNFPLKTKYKRNKNRIYFSGDFEDGEEIEFYCTSDKPSSSAKGYAFYRSIQNPTKTMLININREEFY